MYGFEEEWAESVRGKGSLSNDDRDAEDDTWEK